MNIVDTPSPNFDSRDGHAIDMLVLHYTGMKTAEEALDRLCNPEAKVSSHYLVDEDGAIHRLVERAQRAWHAGKSYWRGNTNINQRSIGIEIVNPGHEFGYRHFPQPQIEALITLCKDILKHHDIPPRNVVAHSDAAPERKEDPGELFPWEWLAQEGIGLWPQTINAPALSAERLADYGYDTANPAKTITAFQRHFRPKLLNGKWDEECGRLLAALLEII